MPSGSRGGVWAPPPGPLACGGLARDRERALVAQGKSTSLLKKVSAVRICPGARTKPAVSSGFSSFQQRVNKPPVDRNCPICGTPVAPRGHAGALPKPAVGSRDVGKERVWKHPKAAIRELAGPVLRTGHGPPHRCQDIPNQGRRAQAWLAEELRLISQQRWSSPSERTAKAAATEAHRRARTFAVYAEQWLATRVTSKGEALRPTTRAGYRNSLDVHILPRFGSLSPGRDHRRSRRSWRGQFSAADMTPPGRRLTSS